MFRLEFTPEALEDMRFLRTYDQRRILDSIQEQLRHQPEQ
jgi:mRNA-degrading endonuclease RelE of RelBE toxin-antitoxin system